MGSLSVKNASEKFSRLGTFNINGNARSPVSNKICFEDFYLGEKIRMKQLGNI
jgi:hypothetical protein